ncbi:MAG: glycosyltransferase family 2 protein [Patescibacteria group bacterium]
MLSIIITHHKNAELLKLCIRSLKDTVKKTAYEIIVAESEADKETDAALKEQFPDVKFIALSENSGYAKSVNEGIRQARGNYLLILNQDIVAVEDAVDDLARFAENEAKKNKIGMAGPKLFGFDNKIQHSAFRFYSPMTILLRRTFLGKFGAGKKHIERFLLKDKNIENTEDPQYVDWLMGSALLVSKKAVEKVGLMDERFFMYFEDVDWARRFWENGYKVVYFPKAKMYHYHGKASRGSILDLFFNKMARIHNKSAILYFLKYKFKTTHYV